MSTNQFSGRGRHSEKAEFSVRQLVSAAPRKRASAPMSAHEPVESATRGSFSTSSTSSSSSSSSSQSTPPNSPKTNAFRASAAHGAPWTASMDAATAAAAAAAAAGAPMPPPLNLPGFAPWGPLGPAPWSPLVLGLFSPMGPQLAGPGRPAPPAPDANTMVLLGSPPIWTMPVRLSRFPPPSAMCALPVDSGSPRATDAEARIPTNPGLGMMPMAPHDECARAAVPKVLESPASTTHAKAAKDAVVDETDANAEPAKKKARWKTSRVGSWSASEHRRFIEAVNLYGRSNWKPIVQHVRTRSAESVRAHGQKYFARLARQELTRKQDPEGTGAE